MSSNSLFGSNRGKFEVYRDILESSKEPANISEIFKKTGGGALSKISGYVNEKLVTSGLLEVINPSNLGYNPVLEYMCTEKGREYLNTMYEIQSMLT